MKEFYLKKSPPLLLRKLEKFSLENVTDEEQEICKKKLLYKAEVFFKISTHTMIAIENSRRLSFFDKLSGFGGILGLFTGMSILSMVEIAFWISHYLVKSCHLDGWLRKKMK